jgi:hypothetical protein
VFGDWQLAAQIDRVLGEASLLQKFSDEILECCQFAAECRRNADKTDDLSRKQFWLDMEDRWLHLARSPAFLEQISTSTRLPERACVVHDRLLPQQGTSLQTPSEDTTVSRNGRLLALRDVQDIRNFIDVGLAKTARVFPYTPHWGRINHNHIRC